MINATVSVPVAGYYEALVSVVQRSGEPKWLDGRLVRGTVTKSVWFVVDDSEGRVTDAFDPSRMPSTWLPTPGPAHDRRTGRPISASGAPGNPAVAALTADSGLRQAVYFNEEPNVRAYVPAAGVLVKWDIWDSIDHSHYGASSVYTDANGYWTAPCVDANMYADGEFQFLNSYVNVLPYGGYGEGTGACTSPFAVFEVPRYSAHVYRNMSAIIPAANAFFAPYARGQVKVSVGSYPISKYVRNLDEVQITYTGANAAIWNGTDGYGGFSQAHEFGHAFHHTALGGIEDNGGACPSTHNFYVGSTLGCAFREGFADYFAAAVYPSGIGGTQSSWLTDVESTPGFPGGDGSIIEGPFAAFLYDLTDPANETKDAIQYAGAYVAATVKSCEVDDYSWPFPIRANGPDHLVYCFERTVDQTLWPTYFSTRGGATQTVLPNVTAPSGWNAAAIRTNWKWNLYRQ